MTDVSPSNPMDYTLFGLRLRSDIALPELFAAAAGGTPDVIIRSGAIQQTSDEFGLTTPADGILLNVPDIARYRITNGNQIVVDVVPGAPDRNVRLYLLGTAMGALLHQKGMLPLHANAIEVDGAAVAFMGESGVGKSTLAAWFLDRGHRLIADDVCVVGFDEAGGTKAMPGLPRLRLWKEALEASGRDPADFERAWDGDDDWDKFEVPLAPQSAVAEPRRLSAIFLLRSGEDFAILPLSGARAAQALIENTYRGRVVRSAADPRLHWEACLRIAGSVSVFELQRPRGLARLDRDMAAVLHDITERRMPTKSNVD